jgi:FkbM family methyltransferase
LFGIGPKIREFLGTADTGQKLSAIGQTIAALSAREASAELSARQAAAELSARQTAAELSARQAAAELSARQAAAELSARQAAAELSARQTAAELSARQTASARAACRREASRPGPAAVYMGKNRLLCRLVIPEIHDPDIIYLLDSSDRLLVPRIAMEGVYERESTHFVIRHLGEQSHCVDIGANFGYFTCIMARRAWRGRTIAVEADPESFVQLRDNIHINWSEKGVTAINRAAADRAGVLRFWRRRGRAANTSIVLPGKEELATTGESPPEAFEVEAIRVDDLLEELDGRVDLLKIDVEGAEPLVFRGARATLSGNPQIAILMEWSPGQMRAAGFAPSDFADELQGYGLRPYALRVDGDIEPITWDDLRESDYGNVVLRSAKA